MADDDTIIAITGVYRADGGWLGELRYVTGKLLGTAHCALCDITHGAFGKKPAFRRCEAESAVPMRMVHENEQPPEVAAHTAGRTPCVVAHTQAGLRTLLGPRELDGLGGDVGSFERALKDAIEHLGLRTPGAS